MTLEFTKTRVTFLLQKLVVQISDSLFFLILNEVWMWIWWDLQHCAEQR